MPLSRPGRRDGGFAHSLETALRASLKVVEALKIVETVLRTSLKTALRASLKIVEALKIVETGDLLPR